MQPKILLINPPIYDFSAYDYYLKPLGMLSSAGHFTHAADFSIFDYLHQARQRSAGKFTPGHFNSKKIKKPAPLADIPRNYYRFGADQKTFQQYLTSAPHFDFVFIQTMMTYWYQGIAEVIKDIRKLSPATKIILGGPYTNLCPDHAKSLCPDILIGPGPENINRLGKFISIEPARSTPNWALYNTLDLGIIKLTQGCPYKCTYCSTPNVYPTFKADDPKDIFAQIQSLYNMGVRDIAFYDDALLYQAEKHLLPLLQMVIDSPMKLRFHTPNALHNRFITPEIAKAMTAAGFKSFCLGAESSSETFQSQTGGKTRPSELKTAVTHLTNAGVNPKNITAYHILGHPDHQTQQIEDSMQYAHSLGLRIMLADFSPIPNTPDGQKCQKYTDIAEPLNHNKTAFPIRLLGNEKVNRTKDLARALNSHISQ